MVDIGAEVAELADALGSGPSGDYTPWRFESSLRHPLISLLLFIAPIMNMIERGGRNSVVEC